MLNFQEDYLLKKWSFSSEHLIPLSYLGAILIGTILLLLPISAAPGNTTNFLTALFTATTSVCVTGLIVVDTFSHWSVFGQAIILILAQIGGLGIMMVKKMSDSVSYERIGNRNVFTVVKR